MRHKNNLFYLYWCIFFQFYIFVVSTVTGIEICFLRGKVSLLKILIEP
nr:MAG TPA: hypothetical protein [Caudoviricetes sp.]